MKKQRKKKEKEKTKEKAREKANKKKSNLVVKLNLIGEKHASYAKEQCSLKADIIHTFLKHHML